MARSGHVLAPLAPSLIQRMDTCNPSLGGRGSCKAIGDERPTATTHYRAGCPSVEAENQGRRGPPPSAGQSRKAAREQAHCNSSHDRNRYGRAVCAMDALAPFPPFHRPVRRSCGLRCVCYIIPDIIARAMDGTYRRLVPLTTMSTLRPPQPAHTSRAFQSSTVV
jgi:hypothetical protein